MESDYAVLLVNGILVAAVVISRVVRVINTKRLSSIIQVSRIEWCVLLACVGFVNGIGAFESKTPSTRFLGGASAAFCAGMAAVLLIRILRDKRGVKPPAPNPEPPMDSN